MASNVLLGFSPNDFFYASADIQGCDETKKCTSLPTDSSAQDACIRQLLCENKSLATKINQQSYNGNAGDEKYADTKLKYDMAFMNVVNLGIGIVFAMYVIYKNQNIK